MTSTNIKSFLIDDESDAQVEFEKLVGTAKIIAKYQAMITEEEPPDSDSSEEPFQFNISDQKAERIKKK